MLPQRIIAIGASIVFGRVDPEHGGFVGRLKSLHEKKFTPNAVFNLGISSQTSTMLLKRLCVETSVRKPDLIIVSVGLNDLKRQGSLKNSSETSIKKFSQNIQNIIRQSKKICNVMFVSLTPVDERKTTPLLYQKKSYILLDDIKKYADATKNICKKEKIPYLDILNKWMKRDYQGFLYKDGMHPNSLGHKDIFLELQSFLKKYYFQKSK